MYVVVLGAGQIGASASKWLIESNHEITTIDRDEHKCASLDNELGSITLVGDGTEADVLAKAGVNRADLFLATTSCDEDNMVACQLARHRFGVAFTVSLVNIPDHERLFNLLGIGVVVNTSDLISRKLREVVHQQLPEESGNQG